MHDLIITTACTVYNYVGLYNNYDFDYHIMVQCCGCAVCHICQDSIYSRVYVYCGRPAAVAVRQWSSRWYVI